MHKLVRILHVQRCRLLLSIKHADEMNLSGRGGGKYAATSVPEHKSHEEEQ